MCQVVDWKSGDSVEICIASRNLAFVSAIPFHKWKFFEKFLKNQHKKLKHKKGFIKNNE